MFVALPGMDSTATLIGNFAVAAEKKVLRSTLAFLTRRTMKSHAAGACAHWLGLAALTSACCMRLTSCLTLTLLTALCMATPAVVHTTLLAL
jgi:hypothetical protein